MGVFELMAGGSPGIKPGQDRLGFHLVAICERERSFIACLGGLDRVGKYRRVQLGSVSVEDLDDIAVSGAASHTEPVGSRGQNASGNLALPIEGKLGSLIVFSRPCRR